MKNYEEYSDEELISLLRQGDDLIMEYILEKYKPLVKKLTNKMYLLDGEEDDLIQEGMIGLFKAVRDFKDDCDSSFFNFARLCINRQLYSAIQASNRKKNIPLNSYISFSQKEEEGKNFEEILGEDSLSPEQLIIEQEKFEDLTRQVDKLLSKMERQVLDLYLDGYNYIQIAEKMEKSPKSIDNALQRIRQKIKQLI